MFLRKKKVKDKHYLYAVENKWKKGKGVKQKVKKYLGRVHKFKESKKRVGFEEFLKIHYDIQIEEYLDNQNDKEIISDLVKWELYKKGFKKEEKKMVKKEISANTHKIKKMLHYKGKPFSIESNEGYINNLTINSLISYKKKENGEWEGDIDKKDVGTKLAKMFVEGGIKIPQEVFIAVFEKKFLE